jgi:hypothetical protein
MSGVRRLVRGTGLRVCIGSRGHLLLKSQPAHRVGADTGGEGLTIGARLKENFLPMAGSGRRSRRWAVGGDCCSVGWAEAMSRGWVVAVARWGLDEEGVLDLLQGARNEWTDAGGGRTALDANNKPAAGGHKKRALGQARTSRLVGFRWLPIDTRVLVSAMGCRRRAAPQRGQ